MRTKSLSRYALAFFLVAIPVGLIPVPAQNPAPAKGVAAVLQPNVDNGSLAGAVVLVANKDKVLTLEAVGYADVAAKRPLMVEAIFWIASMSKPITAAALLLLVDDGKVNLDDPVEKYLPEFKNVQVQVKEGDKTVLRKPKHPPTVREVLSHTSGLPFRSKAEQPTIDVLPLRDAVLSYTKEPLINEPGAKYVYSNAGINTAGRIIEVVSGMPYEEFLDKRLFGPLGMKDTTFWPSEEQLKRLAKSYKPGKAGLEETKVGALKYPLSDRQRGPVPGGGLFATATDVAHFGQMLLNGGTDQGKQILSESAVKQLSSRQTAKDMASYGLGFAVGDGTFGHGGAYATNLTVDTKRGLVTVFMVQHAGFPKGGQGSLGLFQKAAAERFAK